MNFIALLTIVISRYDFCLVFGIENSKPILKLNAMSVENLIFCNGFFMFQRRFCWRFSPKISVLKRKKKKKVRYY